MNQNQIDKLLSLIRTTGDRGIIADNNSDELFVVMDSTNYERFLDHTKSVKGLSEQEMMNKINRDIALWRRQNPETIMESTMDFEETDLSNELETEEDFLEEYWDKHDYNSNTSKEFEELGAVDEVETNEVDTEVDAIEEMPFDELERDGFVVEGEEEEETETEVDEPLYLEKIDNEPLPIGDMETIEEVNIEDDEVLGMANISTNKEDNFVFEEELNDVVDESEEEEFFIEPIE